MWLGRPGQPTLTAHLHLALLRAVSYTVCEEGSLYREVEHTADYAIEVIGHDLTDLFTSAARGMIALTGAVAADSAIVRHISLEALDLETLLVAWLEELAFLMETEGLVCNRFELQLLTATCLRATVAGGVATGLDKPIKAITYHDLAIEEFSSGFRTRLVFDV